MTPSTAMQDHIISPGVENASIPASEPAILESLPLDQIRSLTDIAQIQEQLQLINNEETRLDLELDGLLKQQTELEAKLGSLESVRPQIMLMKGDAESLFKVIANTSLLSERISDHVRQLDLRQSRVKATLNLLSDIQELKDCAAGIKETMKIKDYENAAKYISRYLRYDPDRFEKIFQQHAESVSPVGVLSHQSSAADNAPTTTSNGNTNADQLSALTLDIPMDPSDPLAVALLESGIQVLTAVSPLQILKAAKHSLNEAVLEEFDNALQTGNEEGIVRFFKLFPLIGNPGVGLDRYSGYICGIVSRYCQDGMRNSNDQVMTFYADLLTRLYETVAGLVDKQESFVDSHYGPGRLLRVIQRLQREADIQSSIILDTFADRRQLSRKVSDIAALDIAANQGKPAPMTVQVEPKEVDAVITEIALISQRTQLFQRFLTFRSELELQKIAAEDPNKKLSSIEELAGIEINKNSLLVQRVRELTSNFITLNEFFMRRSIDRAMKIDEYEAGNLTSSCVDDVFYILKTCISRGLSTSDPLTVCSLLESVGRILDLDYMSVFQKKLSTTFTSTESKENRVAFMVVLNNVDVSCDYIQKLVKEVEQDIGRQFPNCSDEDREKMRTCLLSVADFGTSFKKILMTWVENLFNQSIKPRLRPMIQDAYKDLKFVLSEDEYSEQDAQNLFVKKLIANFNRLITLFKKTYTERNYNQTMAHTVDSLTKEWERIIATMKFNQLGALRFDKDHRAVSSHLSSITQWVTRDKFARLAQISTILNLEKPSEIHDSWGPKAGPMTWRLTENEIRKFLSLRVDFRQDEIAGLKL
ncbi:Golgi transport complex subunit 4 [Blyttiomyces sp. JEL0837]|nr:Golgi transport complex subunit 4 [Blyttiomyces sp. JEL0837]